MKAEDYAVRTMEVQGWKVRLSSYKLGEKYLCTADNVEPGAWLARAEGTTREDAEKNALEQARQMLARTRRFPVGAS